MRLDIRAELRNLGEGRINPKFNDFKSTSQNIGNFTYQYINITIGTPDQVFSIYINTNNGGLEISKIGCSTCDPSVRTFDPSKSSTFTSTNKYIFNNSNNGEYGTDTIKFGNLGKDRLIIPKSTFAMSNSFVGGVDTDGRMGLGFKGRDGFDTSIATAIKSGILDKPLVTFFLRYRQSGSTINNDGVITFGAVDTTNCDRNVHYVPLLESSLMYFNFQGISTGSVSFNDNYKARLNIGDNKIFAPSKIVQALATEVNATMNSYEWVIDCNAKFNINFTINGTIITLNQDALVLYHKITKRCSFAMIGYDGGAWSFGNSWFAGVCNVFDYSNHRVGFSKIIT